ncbi:MAG: Hsp20/alpha crystallin family protein [Verrucomicrobiales bacterium]|nr:Hsp20/alpha crystallin family protein [Verrucomicrobiales bacterium]
MASSKISTATQFVTTRPQAPMKAAGNGVAWVPNMDVFSHDDGVVVKAELAGIRREDLTLTVEGNRLRIRGLRRDTPRAPGCRFLMMEIEYGAFEASVELPQGLDMGSARAVYLNGFLRIEFTRAGTSGDGPQRIEVA